VLLGKIDEAGKDPYNGGHKKAFGKLVAQRK
jgi:hypothetical protein